MFARCPTSISLNKSMCTAVVFFPFSILFMFKFIQSNNELFSLKRGKSHHCKTSNLELSLSKKIIKIVLSLNKVSLLYYIPTLTRSLKHQPAQKAACTTSCKREPSVSLPADHQRVFFAPPARTWSPGFALAPACEY